MAVRDVPSVCLCARLVSCVLRSLGDNNSLSQMSG